MHSDDQGAKKNYVGQGRESARLGREVVMRGRLRIQLVAGALSLAGVAFSIGHLSSANSDCRHPFPMEDPIEECQGILSRYRSPMDAKMTWLGAKVKSGPEKPAGALVDAVFPHSPAEAAGLEKGHRIVGFETVPVHSAGGLTRQVRLHEAGEAITVRVRDTSGQLQDIPVVLESISPRELRILEVALDSLSPWQ